LWQYAYSVPNPLALLLFCSGVAVKAVQSCTMVHGMEVVWLQQLLPISAEFYIIVKFLKQ